MGSRRNALVVAAACAVVSLAPGCGERDEPTGPALSDYPVVVDGVGGPVELTREPRRIVTLTRAAAGLVRALGAEARIVAFPAQRDEGTEQGPVPPVSAMKALAPDLIVASPATDPDGLARIAAATGAPVYVAPDRSLRDVERSFSELGLLLGRPLAARRVVDAIEGTRERVARAIAGRRRVSVFVDTGFFVTVSDRTLLGDLIRLAGGRNVAGDAVDPGPFDLRKLARLDPDLYLATSDSGTSLADLRRQRLTRKLSAVRAGRFEIVPVELVQPGRRIARGLALLAHLLHPDAFR